jgi:hypothetical protein
MSFEQAGMLHSAYDIHVHCGPDVVPRAQDLVELAEAVQRAGMAGVVLKDQTSSTAGRAYVLNRLYPSGPHFYSALALNLTVGGLNPYAVEAALREGADIIYLPTYTSQDQITRQPDAFAPEYPRPRQNYNGITILDGTGALKPEMQEIIDLIVRFDAVLATGHASPQETLAVLCAANQAGLHRTVVTHATAVLSVAQQQEAVSYGAFIEHCVQGASPLGAGVVTLQAMHDQIRQVGVEHVIVSSDFGQVSNGPIVEAFARYLCELQHEGFSDDEMRTMIVTNPGTLLGDRPAPTRA